MQDNLSWRADREAGRRTAPPRHAPARQWLFKNSRVVSWAWVHGIRGLAYRWGGGDLPSRNVLESQWPATEEALDRFKAAVGDRPLTVWYLPGLYEWDDGLWGAVNEGGAADDDHRFFVRDQVQNWAGQNSVRFVDTTPMLLHCPTDTVKFPVDGHWQAGGHRLVAEGLAEHPASCARLGRPVAGDP
ncbi:MAG: hypothetical protein ACYSUR_11565 [Planctomycetota bacterium]|jgi:hypothetical protein